MKKKLIALTIATAICTATLSVAGCAKSKPTPPNAMTEDEWKAAWQATYAVTNYSVLAKSDLSDTIKVNKNDFENDNYEIPQIISNNRPPLSAEVSANPFQSSGDFIEGTSDGNNDTYTIYQYKTFTENKKLYYFINRTGDWELQDTSTFESEEELMEFTNRFNFCHLFGNMTTAFGISLENSFSNFTYNSENGSYTGEITSTYGESGSIKMNSTFKFKGGKLSEFSSNSVFYTDNVTYVSIWCMKYDIELFDISTTVPITDEEMQTLKSLIKK